VLGDVTALDQPVERISIAAGSGRSGEQVAKLLAGIRKEEADEKLWTGVSSIEADAGSAEVVFHHGSDPALRPEGGVEVACHLYDPEAIDAARRLGVVGRATQGLNNGLGENLHN